MNLITAIIITAGVLVVVSFVLGCIVGKKGEGYRWHEAYNTKTPIKLRNRLYEVKLADINKFIDE